VHGEFTSSSEIAIPRIKNIAGDAIHDHAQKMGNRKASDQSDVKVTIGRRRLAG
jgi:hypothetical protein